MLSLSQSYFLLDAMPLNVAVYTYVDNDFVFAYLNGPAEHSEGILKEDIIGKALTDVFPNVKEFGLYDVLLRVYKSGKAETLDLGFYQDARVNGWYQNDVTKLENGDIMAVYSDLAEKRNSLQHSFDQEEQLKNLGYIVDNSINEIYIFSLKNLHFTYLNNAAKKNIGYTLQEMKELTPVNLKPNHTLASFNKTLTPLLKREKEFIYFETIYERKNKSKYNAEVRIQIMNINHEEQVVVVANDITDRKFIESELKASEEKFRNIAEGSLIGIFIYQENFNYTNKELATITGYSIQELKYMKPWELVEEANKENIKKVMSQRLQGEKFTKEYADTKISTKNGDIKTVRIATQTIMYENKPAGMGTVTDISDIMSMKKEVKLLNQAIKQMGELVRITDRDGIITFVNDALLCHTGYKEDELLGKNVSILKSGEHESSLFKELWDTVLAGETFRGVFINRKKDNTFYHEEQIITPIFNEEHEIEHFIATGSDITQRIEMEKELKKFATIDTLTGIYNRRKIDKEIEIEISRANRHTHGFTLLMLDIDNFKTINDTYGHDIGDSVLKEFTALVLSHIRKSDRFGRWGGEEFMITLPESNIENIKIFGEKLRESVEKYKFKGIQKLTVSIGFTIFKENDTKMDIIKRADLAMYQVKESGRNNIAFVL